MKRICSRLALAGGALLSLPASPALAAPDIGVSIGVNQPGFYGRVDIGGARAAPVLVYPQPLIIAPPPRVLVQRPPIYLHVPPGHAQHWHKHCGRYGACGQPVYFVQEGWYRPHYGGPQWRNGGDYRPDDRRDHRPDGRGHRRHD